jgi:hypothetical protein
MHIIVFQVLLINLIMTKKTIVEALENYFKNKENRTATASL